VEPCGEAPHDYHRQPVIEKIDLNPALATYVQLAGGGRFNVHEAKDDN